MLDSEKLDLYRRALKFVISTLKRSLKCLAGKLVLTRIDAMLSKLCLQGVWPRFFGYVYVHAPRSLPEKPIYPLFSAKSPS
jgi:hypothetical protein